MEGDANSCLLDSTFECSGNHIHAPTDGRTCTGLEDLFLPPKTVKGAIHRSLVSTFLEVP